jgi:hypothetical protein
MKTMMRRLLGIGLAAFWLGSGAATPPPPCPPAPDLRRRPTTRSSRPSRAVQVGPEVTLPQLHNQAAHQVMKSVHWTWEKINPATGKRSARSLPPTISVALLVERAALHQLPRRLRLDRHELRFHEAGQRRLPRLPRQHRHPKFGTDAGHPLRRPRIRADGGAAGQKAFKAPTSPGSLST